MDDARLQREAARCLAAAMGMGLGLGLGLCTFLAYAAAAATTPLRYHYSGLDSKCQSLPPVRTQTRLVVG